MQSGHRMASFDSNGRDPSFAVAQQVPDVGPAVRGDAGALRKIRTAAGAAALPSSTIPQFGDPDRGSFSPVVDWPLVGIHAVITPDGKVLSYGTDEDGIQTGLYIYDVWDPAQGLGLNAHTTLSNTTEVDIFCSSQLLLANGTIEIYGGDITVDGNTENEPNPDITRFQPTTMALTRVGQMHRERWYSSANTLLNGEVYIQGGKGGADFGEVRTATGTRLLTGAPTGNISSGYPRNFVRTDGTVFGIAAARMYTVNTAGTGSLKFRGTIPTSNTGGTSSAVMYAPNQILQVGGGVNRSLPASAEARRIDITNPAPQLTTLASMRHRRHWGNATVLPNGTVFVSGGSAVNNSAALDANGNGVAYTSELYAPGNNTWTVGATAARMRLYHSTNLLLPDATVLTMGGGAPGPQRNLNAEIYYPPYLFNDAGQRATRPVIQSAPTGLVPGAKFTIRTATSGSIGQVVLIKSGSVTHSFNFDQRFLPLAFTRPTTSTLRATVPPLSRTPPGYYLLFIVNNAGVPSEAAVIRIAP
ncbi:MAG TPA: galactose oxidase early set domain-containing protein [Nocardioidaceae bacterium]|nr:galactose oxidase early set domain-containing protein [Nocardioidaceae bacterium]